MGIGVVYLAFLIVFISCSSKPKCAKLEAGLGARMPDTCKHRQTHKRERGRKRERERKREQVRLVSVKAERHPSIT